MRNPQIKCINTISLKFITGERSFSACKKILKDTIGLESNDILGVGHEGKNSINVKFTNEITYRKASAYHGDTFDINEHTVVKLLDISTYKVRVNIKNIPFEVPNSILQSILDRHGQVESVHYCFHL